MIDETLTQILHRIETGETTAADADLLRGLLASAPRLPESRSPQTITDWVRACGKLMTEKGFELDEIDRQLLLIVSEVIEAHSAYRNKTALGGRFREAFAEEIADVVYRVFSFCYGNDIDLEAAVIAKHEKNQRRPYRHGKDF